MRENRDRPDLPAHEKRRVAVVAKCDPRSVDSYRAGKARAIVAARIEAALVELGYLEFLRGPRA